MWRELLISLENQQFATHTYRYQLIMVVALVVVMPMLVLTGLDGFLVVLLCGNPMLVPVGVMLLDPIGVTSVPPIAIVPFVMLVEVTVASPVGMILGPLGMVLVHPAGIVLMPPVRVMPMVIPVVVTIAMHIHRPTIGVERPPI